ncbi:MAG: hypothetical protein ACRERX_00735 [Pseudomonas sp.]
MRRQINIAKSFPEAPPKEIDRTQIQDSIPEKSDGSVGAQEYKPNTRLINEELGKAPLSYSTSNAAQTAIATAQRFGQTAIIL